MRLEVDYVSLAEGARCARRNSEHPGGAEQRRYQQVTNARPLLKKIKLCS